MQKNIRYTTLGNMQDTKYGVRSCVANSNAMCKCYRTHQFWGGVIISEILMFMHIYKYTETYRI